ncbi:hypothetical protein PMAYCL1PPCAC_05856, partial [Pristionchus mayeri]
MRVSVHLVEIALILAAHSVDLSDSARFLKYLFNTRLPTQADGLSGNCPVLEENEEITTSLSRLVLNRTHVEETAFVDDLSLHFDDFRCVFLNAFARRTS